MRKKIKQVLCMFSALVVMICCAVPAFALTNSDLPTGSYNPEFEEQYKTALSYLKSKYPDKFKNYVMMLPYYDSSFNQIGFYWFNCDNSNNFEVYEKNKSYYIKNTDSKSFTSYRIFFSTRSSLFGDLYVNGTSSTDNFDYVLSCQIYDTNCNVKFGDKYEFGKPKSEVPAPFSVTYSPDLKLNLKRKTSDYETKSIDVTLTLNQDYLDWYIRRYAEMKLNVEVGKLDSESIEAILGTKNLAEVFDLTGCGKSKCIYFISLSDPSKPLRTVTQNSVYTYLSQQRYSIVDKDNGDIDGSTSTAVYANGLYPYFTVDFKEYFKHTMQSDIASENCSYKKYQAVIKNLPTYQLSIPLENIDAEKFEVISVLNSILTCETLFPTESGQSVFNGSFKSAYSVDRGPNGVNFNNIDYINVDKWDTDDTGYLDYFSKSDCYSVYTAQFSFDSYPKYVPLKDGKGNDIDMIKTNPFDFSKSPVAPGTYQSVNKDGTLSEERTLEEQKKHDKDNTFSKNFASVDYTDFSSIFSTSSSYFEFLTASIRILPDWFIATFTAWFVTFLTLALIKYVIQ